MANLKIPNSVILLACIFLLGCTSTPTSQLKVSEKLPPPNDLPNRTPAQSLPDDINKLETDLMVFTGFWSATKGEGCSAALEIKLRRTETLLPLSLLLYFGGVVDKFNFESIVTPVNDVVPSGGHSYLEVQKSGTKTLQPPIQINCQSIYDRTKGKFSHPSIFRTCEIDGKTIAEQVLYMELKNKNKLILKRTPGKHDFQCEYQRGKN